MAAFDPKLAGSGQLLRAVKIIDPIGGGGQAQVYLGVTKQGLQVALKCYRDTNPAMREITLLSKVTHLNVLRVLDYGTLKAPGTNVHQSTLALEYCPHGDLQSAMQEGLILASKRTFQLLHGMASGLAACARHGVVHRDLKPANFLITVGTDLSYADVLKDPEICLIPKLADFGLGKLEVFAANTSHQLAGTLAYMAPERVMKQTDDGMETAAVSNAADVYSLGCCFWHVLMCAKEKQYVQTPVVSMVEENGMENTIQMLTTDPTSAWKTAQLPDELGALLRSMLSADPNSRPCAKDVPGLVDACIHECDIF